MARVEIRQGDAYNTGLETGSVDLVVTSPPYFSFREYTDGEEAVSAIGNEEHPWQYLKALLDWASEMRRVLTPEGNMFVVLGDKYSGSGGHNNAGFKADKKRGPKRYSQSSQVNWTQPAIQKKSQLGLPTRYANLMTEEQQWVLRQTIIWSKPNGIPTNAKDRCEFTHEYVFHFTPNPSHYAHPDLRSLPFYKSSVWDISSSEGLRYPKHIFETLGTDKHYAAFPVELVRRIITGWSPENGMVLDPFGGSGTVALAAKILGRRAISLDLSAGYTRLARWRVHVSDHESKLRNNWGLGGESGRD